MIWLQMISECPVTFSVYANYADFDQITHVERSGCSLNEDAESCWFAVEESVPYG